MLYKGDHTHRLPETLADDDPQNDGDASLGKQQAGQPIRTLSPGSTPTRLRAPEEDSLGPSSPPRSSPRRDRMQRRLTSKRLGMMEPQDFMSRQKALRSSFRLEAPAVEAGLLRLRKWQMLSDPGSSTTAFRNVAVQKLVDVFEESGLRKAPIRANRLVRDNILGGTDTDNPEVIEDDRAPRTELASAIAVLNFVRWLCGLQPVFFESSRGNVCDVVSQALLPRSTESQKMGRGPKAVAKAVEQLLETRHDRISVFHGEASLVVAIEKCLGATHLVKGPSPQQGRDRESLARMIANQVESRQTKEGQSGWLGESNQVLGVQRKQKKTIDEPPPQPLLGIGDLPPPLQPLRILWELQTTAAQPKVKLGRRYTQTLTHAAEQKRESEGSSPRHIPTASPKAETLNARQSRSLQAEAAAGAPVAAAKSSSSRQPGPRVVVAEEQTGHQYGLSNIWGDRRGALGFRRCLLSPSLQAFAAARRHDTCVFWTGTDQDLEESARGKGPRAEPQMQNDAVCYPPAGPVPLVFLEGGRTPWTIMPDSTRFQPTASTNVRVWRVKIDRSGKEWIADRTEEVTVKGLAVDCSTRGEPFCVIFWPGIGQPTVHDQLEVELTGLCGVTHTLHFFYEVHSFVQADFDYGLYVEAGANRSLLGDPSLWQQPMATAPMSPLLRTRSYIGGFPSEVPVIETVSHHKTSFGMSSVDMKITLRCRQQVGIATELYIMRFGEEEELVAHGTQVQRLPEGYLFVRVKIPMARCRYELRFWYSVQRDPATLHQHTLKYMITAAEQCQTLLSSLEDPLLKMFGLARVTPMAHHHGVILLAPTTNRIIAGQAPAYFLVYVNEALALGQAQAEVNQANKRGDFKSDAANTQAGRESTTTLLFSNRLLVREPKIPLVPEVADMHEVLRSSIEPHTQDSQGQIHLDLTLQGGGCLRQLRERRHFPGLYEGLVNFADADAGKTLRLMVRFPRTHAVEYAPRAVCEWTICRAEHFPINF